MRRFSRALLLVGLLTSLFVPSIQAQSAAGAIKIGFLLDSLKVERWQTDVNSFEKRASELGATTLVENADGNDQLQFEQAKKLLDAGVKALVIVAHDTDQAARIVALAKEKKVPVISESASTPR